MLDTMTRMFLLAALAFAPMGCGDGEKAPEKTAKEKAAEAADKTEAGRPTLDPTEECAAYFEANQKGGAKDAFMAACVKDISLIACTGPAANSGFCTRAKKDANSKQLIEDMTAGLGL